ncbi:MAG: DUF3284 domain-containing protein [Schleiferilactobacillus perolens]|jgi:hypothetical protein|uniref:DUF3284 domain-containing protein n=1 Tax=Schleiferilactobacillus perolens DSM 12744 TaxID=1423792 RepID=A0A0R1N654_9LACO|nr:DUF3284 domain-containing protein [Schleiferilactobacillus perolens]KRL12251.1 hypothetical protein FD09_GL003121 [Schleiferilactobacillus perolens DSM 12744]MCI1891199.1 DUF3284 domain-containing protein [Schleiferilactobacillus harbinensis]MCI1911863.1 DUF3284 domain-containing protein [Schleiferilactobacillus harbinensis]
MEITKTLAVPAPYLWHKILESVLFDARKATGKPLRENQLAGLTYTKTFANHQKATLQIMDLVPNERYEYQTRTDKNTYTVTYALTAVDNEHTSLTYTEDMGSKGGLQAANDMLTSLLLGWGRKRNFKKMLAKMEEEYHADDQSAAQ